MKRRVFRWEHMQGFEMAAAFNVEDVRLLEEINVTRLGRPTGTPACTTVIYLANSTRQLSIPAPLSQVLDWLNAHDLYLEWLP